MLEVLVLLGPFMAPFTEELGMGGVVLGMAVFLPQFIPSGCRTIKRGKWTKHGLGAKEEDKSKTGQGRGG